MVDIQPVTTEAQHQHVHDLIDEFKIWDAEATRAAGFDADTLAEFYYSEAYNPDEFNPPSGLLLLATVDGKPAGCGGIHKIGDGIGEIKRMYVSPAYRGKRIARTILEQLVAVARAADYRILRLDTAVFMTEAQALYRSVGFEYRDAYYPIPESLNKSTVFMEMSLTDQDA